MCSTYCFHYAKGSNEQVQKWLDQKFVKHSSSEYASPIVLVGKKIVRDNLPIVQMDNVIEKVQGETIFTTLDLTKGYFHVPVDVNSQKYTKFVTQKGQYDFLYVPLGISPAQFTRSIMVL